MYVVSRTRLSAERDEQVLDPVQGDDRLAGARAAGDLRRTAVRDAVGDAPLRGVQEDPPGRERLVEDLGQLVGAR